MPSNDAVNGYHQRPEQTKVEAVKQHANWANCVPVDTQVYGNRPSDIPAEEWKVRVDLAAVYRLCYRQELCEGINNHLTALVPGTKNRFLVFPFGLHWSEVKASSLLVVDEDGTVLKGKGAAEATAFYIHKAIHQRHPKGFAVMHTHQTYTAAICALKNPLVQMVHQNSCRFYQDQAWDEYNGLVLDHDEGQHIADVMGERRLFMHQNHGPILCAESVAACYDRLYYLEQCLAMAAGPLHIITDKAVIFTAVQAAASIKNKFVESGVHDEYARLHLEAMKRKMLRSEEDKDFIL